MNTETHGTAGEQRNPIVLVVDDNPTNLGVLFECLGSNGFKVLIAEDGESALAQAVYARPDIILLDVMMPGMDGFETCGRLRAEDMTRDIPVIFMTALTEAAHKVRSFTAGAVDYITKPFQHEEVLVRLTNHLRIRNLQKRLEAQNARLEREVAQRREAERALGQRVEELGVSNAELDAYARTVAHDLKDPLARILGAVEVIEEERLVSGEAQGYIDIVAQTGRQMNDSVRALLLLSYVRDAEVITEPLDMAAVVARCRDKLAHRIAEHGADVTAPATWPGAIGYAPWVEHVWVNYLSNALKYGGRPPIIELGAAVEGDEVSFWIRDNGPGLSDADKQQLFAEFTQLRRDRGKGHGLGLSIVRRIVTRLGGRVGVRSLPEERGSEFFFTLRAA